MNTAGKTYETTFIVNASLDDAQVNAVIARVQNIISKNGGVIVAVNKWGRKRLAYPISKRTNGFYVLIEFEGPATILEQLERSYQLDEMILRHLTLRLNAKALSAKANALAIAPPTESPSFVPTREPLFDESDKAKGDKIEEKPSSI